MTIDNLNSLYKIATGGYALGNLAGGAMNSFDNYWKGSNNKRGLSIDPSGRSSSYYGPPSKKNQRSNGTKAQGLMGSGELLSNVKTLAPLRLNLGPAYHSKDSVSNYLKNLLGSGKTTCSWTGNCTSLIGKRGYHYEIFRHRMPGTVQDPQPPPPPGSTIGNVTSGAYFNYTNDIQSAPCYLFPEGSTAQFNGQTISSAPYVFQDNSQWFAPLNRADYEDDMWNLVGIKPNNGFDPYGTNQMYANIDYSQNGGAPNSAVKFTSREPVQQGIGVGGFHRKQSRIQLNNSFFMKDNSVTANGDFLIDNPYRLEAYFKSGTVDYEFMNKNDTGVKIEVIVYRIKKNAQCSGFVSDYGIPDTTTNPIAQSQLAVANGYLASVQGVLGTDRLRGRTATDQDHLTNPDFPFQPMFKKTKQSLNPLKEVMRTSFSMVAGARRTLNVKLPGDRYDPQGVPVVNAYASTAVEGYNSTTVEPFKLLNQTTDTFPWTYKTDSVSIVDEHSYVICINTVGERLSRIISKVDALPASDQIFLDEYAPSNVQYYATYTENIGSAIYADPGSKRVYVAGTAQDINTSLVTPASSSIHAGVILDLASTVRQAATIVQDITNAAGDTGSINIPATNT